MKPCWIGTSWKMNKTGREATKWIENVVDYLQTANCHHQIFVIPPFPYIEQVSRMAHVGKVLVGAQNMCWDDAGAYTGEISPIMLKDCGATLVEIGHSERRHWFNESDETVNKKVLAALKHGLRPLICVGDTEQEKNWSVSVESVVRQVKIALHNVPHEKLSSVIIAYEPVWAIGDKGIPATEEEAEFIHSAIRTALTEMYDKEIADSIYILYGGSVNHSNAVGLLKKPNIDGVFIGRSAWDSEDFCRLIQISETLSVE
ncbi:triose-phosphate isomerase [Vibrio salinus]|uniref:triose-phosphate isomerase n=1 Tax=Vibrio salinus TaxID=2899784 RepID=UPI001E2EF1D9|nr:triose-phosphate isomerase [Vibrio salinus]MCE0494886.1 triose-phosphate isomerase [Vibrio salinus]